MHDGNELLKSAAEPVRLVLSGCGSVTQLYYAEALSRLSDRRDIRLVGIFDPDADASDRVRVKFPEARAVETFDDLLQFGADVAIIASPPRYHAEQATRALQRGLHVFCEKPLATSSAESQSLVILAQERRSSAAVGLVRRHFPAALAIRQLLQSGAIGNILSVSCFEGGPFIWPISSQRYFTKAESGGGILLDIGSHCIDLLTWWMGPARIVSYEDDAMGGVEANCRVCLDLSGVKAVVRLSRDWARPNLYRIDGEHGWISWAPGETDRFELCLHRTESDGIAMFCRDEKRQTDFIGCFTAQIESFIGSTRSSRAPDVPIEAGHDVLTLIERCYEMRRLMPMPWLSQLEQDRLICLNR